MKQFIGLFMLVIVLVAVSGCTQTAKPTTTETTLVTSVPTTEVPAVVNTTVPKTVPVTVSTTAASNVSPVATTAATPRPSLTPSTKITTIHIKNNTFVPAELTVLPGTGITWINDDSVTHIVKASGNAQGKFTSAELINGARFGYTFGDATGTYEFVDPNYPAMKGAIIVKKGDTLWVATVTPLTTS
jgi:plastocyanin